jgi:hypothetical protein
MTMRRQIALFVRATSLLLLSFALMAVPVMAAHGDNGGHVVGDDVIDTPIEMDASHDGDEQHGGVGGHLPASSLNVQLVGQVTVSGIVPGRISDVGVLGNYAYLGAFNQPCGAGGVYIVDISDPTSPTEVGFIPTASGSFVGEGVQAIKLNTPAFKGDILVFNNEICGISGSQIGGFSLYDVTNPLAPVPLALGAGDTTPSNFAPTNQIHSAFAWQQEKNAYVVIVDDEEVADVDIFDITNPSAPVQIAEVGLANWPGAQNAQSAGIGTFRASFLHDMVVKKVQGHWMMLMSYWDAGYIVLNVDNPTAPVFVNDTDFIDPDPETGFSPPEGNAHQSEWSHNNKYIIASDEDFSPFRTTVGITSGPFAGSNFIASQGNAVPQITPGSPLSGPTYFVGLACGALPPAPVAGAIAVVERGTCTFTTKVTNVQNAGYTAGIVMNSAALGNCEGIVNMAAAGTIPFLFVSRSTGFAILGITGYNPANCPTGSNPALPSAGTAGSTVTISAVFDGWGYVHLFDAATLQEIDTYAVAEALNPAFATGFGALSVHEVAMDIESDLAYLSYYDAGLRVIKFDGSGIQEVGHFIDANGNDFWGVQVFRLPGDPTEQTYVAASDRDSGLWIFQYIGP